MFISPGCCRSELQFRVSKSGVCVKGAMSSTVAAVAKPIASPSTFAELLRRSRFASYDPAIRQAYSSPAGHAHRGDWGLKRPISVRRRNAFISLASFEHHANFTEWNNAESEVRFIRRIEEMSVAARSSPKSSWFKSLGRAKDAWLIDSEFCPGEVDASGNEGKQTPIAANLVNFGNRGPGQYGPNRPHEGQSKANVIPNFSGMSEKQFKRYLRKLSALRPEFKEYLTSRANKSLYELSQNTSTSNHHTSFLSDRTAQDYCNRSSRKIEDQPHRNAALMYAHSTPLDSTLTTQAQPGIILQQNEIKSSSYSMYNTPHGGFLASFGGLCTFVKTPKSGGKVALFNFDSEDGIVRSEHGLKASVGNMRMDRLYLLQPPRVVGRHAQGLADVKLESRAVVQSSHASFQTQNMHQPGTPEYIAMKPKSASHVPVNLPKQESQFDRVQLHDNRMKGQHVAKEVLTRLDDLTVKSRNRPDFD